MCVDGGVLQSAPNQLPPIKWAQRADSLYITIDVADIKNQVIVLDENTLSFRCVCGAGG